VGRAETTWTTKKAGRANRQTDQMSEAPITLSAFGSSSQGGFMLNHRLVWLYQFRQKCDVFQAATLFRPKNTFLRVK